MSGPTSDNFTEAAGDRSGLVSADLAVRPATAERSPAGATVVRPTARDIWKRVIGLGL
jgi:hypothetical protein